MSGQYIRVENKHSKPQKGVKVNLKISTSLTETSWNQFTDTEGIWSFFQSFDWGEVQKKIGTEVIRFGVNSHNELLAVAQIFVTYAKRGTYLHIRQGPVIKSRYTQNTELWQFILSYIQEIARKKKAWFIRLGPMFPNSDENKSFLLSFGCRPAPIHAMDGEYAWILDLSPAENDLLFAMRKTTKYLIRHAQKLGVVIEKKPEISDFLKLYEITSKRHRFVPHTGLLDEYRIFSAKNACELLLAKYEGQLLSGAIIIYYGKQAIYHHGASITSKIPASYLLQWEAIKRAKKRGMTLYNFWGIAPSNKPNHPWKGITLFKQGFGGEVKEFLHAYDLPTSPLYSISYSIELIRKFKKGL